jgi:DNA (cytosine-5)-methyltransferase 1
MLGVGLHAAIPGLRTVCYVEREAYAAATLVARMADAALDQAPVWDDLRSFDSRPWRGAVDIVSAGFPCQPHSVAGRRRGADDERWLFDDILRIVRECAAPVVFLENVPGLLSSNRGADFQRVLVGLAALGFDAQWVVVGAGAVGAAHRRDRVFILANREDMRGRAILGRQPHGAGESVADAQLGGFDGDHRGIAGVEPADRRGELADAALDGRRQGRPEPHGPVGQPVPLRCGEPLADPSSERGTAGLSGPLARHEGRARIPDDDCDQGLRLFAPGPNDARWPAILAVRPDVEPTVRRVADGLAHRVDRLRLAGNGVVPLAAAVAFRVLADRALESMSAEQPHNQPQAATA